MAVNLTPPDPVSLRPVRGVKIGFAEAGIRKSGRRDLMVMQFAAGTEVSGVFTQNSFAAAPVLACRERLKSGSPIRALVVNAGNANCGTGAQGVVAAQRTCEAVARLAGCSADQVLPFSTGVILEPLPVDRIEAALPACFASLDESNWAGAAAAIMTTDTVAKARSEALDLGGTTVAVTGIAKGVGMLSPNMATMLSFLATDAPVSRRLLDGMVGRVADRSFNRVTVDGDTSTNDSFVIAATGAAGGAPISDASDPRAVLLEAALIRVAAGLAQSIARDGEGATKFITILVEGGADDAEALRVARGIANSPLVKTAMFASDPNLGRLLMAIGNAGVSAMDTSKVNLWLGAVQVIEGGGRAASYREEAGAAAMQPEEISVRVSLGRGAGQATVWTCDFSYDYVKINAEYRT